MINQNLLKFLPGISWPVPWRCVLQSLKVHSVPQHSVPSRFQNPCQLGAVARGGNPRCSFRFYLCKVSPAPRFLEPVFLGLVYSDENDVWEETQLDRASDRR